MRCTPACAAVARVALACVRCWAAPYCRGRALVDRWWRPRGGKVDAVETATAKAEVLWAAAAKARWWRRQGRGGGEQGSKRLQVAAAVRRRVDWRRSCRRRLASWWCVVERRLRVRPERCLIMASRGLRRGLAHAPIWCKSFSLSPRGKRARDVNTRCRCEQLTTVRSVFNAKTQSREDAE